MTTQEKEQKCKEFFDELSEKLKDTHVVMKSCNKDNSVYLVPKGTEKEVTYYGKPIYSFRISDHWNWKSNLKKNPNPWYVQCLNVDLMPCKKRTAPESGSSPIWAWNVAMFGTDKKYHTMIGEIWDRKTGWEWCDIRDRIFNGMDDWIDSFRKHYNISD